jgi:hypothetical protein
MRRLPQPQSRALRKAIRKSFEPSLSAAANPNEALFVFRQQAELPRSAAAL